MATSQFSTTEATVVLTPRYWVPLGFAIAALALGFLNISLGIVLALLAAFLAFQAATIQLRFTPQALELYRGENQLRQFPYADWLTWQIFWSPIPILFYYKEVKSIHFMPMLFDAKTLLTCLEDRCPRT
ncbi:MAG: DUF3119 family protein [Acaryochloridaceae cyanobacterium SU_2_1]|nr:DUF3119 family protein [Acaryochloridaceae cyanobacterium SU_2_1]